MTDPTNVEAAKIGMNRDEAVLMLRETANFFVAMTKGRGGIEGSTAKMATRIYVKRLLRVAEWLERGEQDTARKEGTND